MTGSNEDLPAFGSSARNMLAIPAFLLTIVLALFLLEIDKQVLLPILLVVIAVYILIETERFLSGRSLLCHFPKVLLRLIVLACPSVFSPALAL